MDTTIFLFLLQDGITNGMIYAMVALALVLVFSVTRVILIPQGEFITFGTLTVAALEGGRLPGTVWLLLALGGLAAISEVAQHRHELTLGRISRIVTLDIALPVCIVAVVAFLAPLKPGPVMSAILTLVLITPMGPMIYRIAFDPIAKTSVLVLLIAAFGVHYSLLGLGLLFFGPEGVGTLPLSPSSFEVGNLIVTGQSLMVIVATTALLVVFGLFFGWSLFGKALRACASNGIGARLSGIPTSLGGQLSFAISAGLGAVSGVLIGPLMTVYYDSGFLIGLKGFVAAILAGLVSYPLAVGAALGVGVAEALFSFWASAFKEVLVFSLIIPVLMWRSLTSGSSAAHN